MESESDPFSEYVGLQPDGRRWYYAGFPSYPRNFSRDTLVSAVLSSHQDLLSTQLEESSVYQAQAENQFDGAKPGKIHHEYPGMSQFQSDDPADNPPEKKGYYTSYNACDSNGLYLINVEQQLYLDQQLYSEFLRSRLAQIEKAANFILAQTDVEASYLYTESPPVGADFFRLRVTYWKDSALPNPEGKTEPVYPAFYPQAHFIAARGILSASRILKDESLKAVASQMFQSGIATAISDEGYLAYRDNEEDRYQASSDELHSLAYIPKEYAGLLPLDAITERASEHLATPFGFACTPKEISDHLINQYHGYKVWPWEQALIAYGAKKFGLDKQAETAAAVAPHIGTGHELFDIVKRGNELVPGKNKYNDRQLFSIAAKIYFEGSSLLAKDPWL